MKVTSTVTGITSPATIEVPQSRRKTTRMIGSQNQAEQNGVTHAFDGFAHDDRLIVERLDLDSGWKRLANLFDLSVDFVRDLHRIAVGLPVDVEQHGRLSVGRNNCVDRLHSRRDRGHVSDAYRNSGGGVLDDGVRDLLAEFAPAR